MAPFAHQQATQLGAGIGIAGVLLQLGFHRFAQALGLVAALQQLGSIALMEQSGFAAMGHCPVGFLGDQGLRAVIDHRVIRAAPLDLRVPAEQTTDAGIGGHRRADFKAQQVDHQHVGIRHQRLQFRDDFRTELFVGVEHQHPVAAQKGQGGVPRRGEVAGPGNLFHPCTSGFGDGDRAVLRSGVHHDHFIDESLHGGETGAKPCLLVTDDHRQAQHHHRPGQWARG